MMTQVNDQGKALLDAARNNHHAQVEEILKRSQGCPPIVTDALKQTALHWAVIHGNAEIVNALLTYHFPKNTRNIALYTPIVLAAELGQWNCLDAFTQHQQGGVTQGLEAALLYAVKERQFLTAKRLVKSGAECNAVWTTTQFKPLHWAVENSDPAMIRLLLAHGAHQQAVDDIGEIPLLQACKREAWACVMALAENPGLEPHYYSQALLLAAKANQYHVVRVLLNAGADPCACASSEGYNALHWAVIHHAPLLFALLVSHGAAIATYDQRGQTPIHLAFRLNRTNLIRWFKPLGVDENVMDNNQPPEPALQVAVRLGKSEAIQALYETQRYPSDMVLAIAKNDIGRIRELLAQGVSLEDKINSERQTSLEYAITLNQAEAVSALLETLPPADPHREKAFKKAVQLKQWQCAKAIDPERAIAAQLDALFYQRLSWLSFSNAKVKASFMQAALVAAEEEPLNRTRYYRWLADSKTATYRQFQFWRSDPTRTSQFFEQKAALIEVPPVGEEHAALAPVPPVGEEHAALAPVLPVVEEQAALTPVSAAL